MLSFPVLISINKRDFCLDFETTALSATSCTFKFAAFRADIGLDMVMSVHAVQRGGMTKMTVHFSGRLTTTKENGIGTLWGSQRQLIKGQHFPTGLDNTRTSTFREAQGTDSELRYVKQTNVIGNGTNDDRDLVLFVLHITSNTCNRHRGLVRATHVQTLQDTFVELGISTPGQETIQLQISDDGDDIYFYICI
jgi:hypothetical protein